MYYHENGVLLGWKAYERMLKIDKGEQSVAGKTCRMWESSNSGMGACVWNDFMNKL